MTNPTEAPMANAIDDVKGVAFEKEMLALMVKHLDPNILGHLTYEHGPYSITKIKNSIMTLLSAVRLASPAPSQHTGWSDEAVEADGTGWVFWNPDSGEEYYPDHPVKAGICEDAERIRHSTTQEDVLYEGMQKYFALAASSIAPATGFEVKKWLASEVEKIIADAEPLTLDDAVEISWLEDRLRQLIVKSAEVM